MAQCPALVGKSSRLLGPVLGSIGSSCPCWAPPVNINVDELTLSKIQRARSKCVDGVTLSEVLRPNALSYALTCLKHRIVDADQPTGTSNTTPSPPCLWWMGAGASTIQWLPPPHRLTPTVYTTTLSKFSSSASHMQKRRIGSSCSQSFIGAYFICKLGSRYQHQHPHPQRLRTLSSCFSHSSLLVGHQEISPHRPIMTLA